MHVTESLQESGIDLKLLTNVLTPAAALAEVRAVVMHASAVTWAQPDEKWDFLRVFTEIKSEFENERELKVWHLPVAYCIITHVCPG